MAVKDTDYLHQLQALLPQGSAWPRDDDALLTRLLSAFAAGLNQVDARGEQLVSEVNPRATAELLADWERVTGLPDPCVVTAAQAQSLAQRRAALLARLAMLGGQSKAYFIALAAALGYSITVTEFRPFLAGRSHAGEPIAANWKFTWQVNAQLNTVVPFRAGNAVAGDPINSWGNKALECVIGRFKPANTNVVFSYS